MSDSLSREVSARAGFRWIPALTWLHTDDQGWVRAEAALPKLVIVDLRSASHVGIPA